MKQQRATISTPVPLVDICLVTRVAHALEALLQQQWGLGGMDLHDAIQALARLGVPRHTVAAAHALRMQRNRVLHQPAQPLQDREAFSALAHEVLAVLQRTACPTPPVALPTTMGGLVLDEMRQQNQARMQALTEHNASRLAALQRRLT